MTDPNPPTPLNDRELTAYIVATLRGAPEDLYKAETYLAEKREALSAARQELEATELDAKINAVATGKNAEERKLQAEQAVMKSESAKSARTYFSAIEADIAGREIEQKKYSRQFQAALALAELQAARLGLMSTTNRKETVK